MKVGGRPERSLGARRRGEGRDVRRAGRPGPAARSSRSGWLSRVQTNWPTIGRGIGLGDGAVVQHREHQVLEGHGMLAAMLGEQHQRRGEAAAGALAGHHDAAGIDAERVGLGVQPGEAGVAVLHRSRMRRLRRQAIVHRDHHGAELQPHTGRRSGRSSPADPRMKPPPWTCRMPGRPCPASCGAVTTRRTSGAPSRPGACRFVDPHFRRQGRQRRAHRGHHLAHLADARRLERQRRHLGERRHFRIEQMSGWHANVPRGSRAILAARLSTCNGDGSP